ncbi:diacylglycerol/polyprenol kinase family protein [Fischerella thermalis]|uniref:Phosphatidate cytidylyltransferase n=1 Tax=Fischerella thermalis JSC-11 TaxID=741277 RepID=G6FQI4_9CYAN|nr:phosphatidate cytidylyltransferase [Fischerella thermalis]PLZ79026.1 phosphatidate cytidylyltransferase [Fischerella thermalis WC217]EHC18069.1 phosphatidate cytidylyltransferase [Fischerella thermalis JSC-11]PLZ09315.1 phosphatidate cytidylyltransferase [Fischerella thermalis WC114]PLZ11607.1 phosphatidate cytidylyltransferase [Fischerella thermalis WC1110]PLZ12452.1 phosphatidate cytidylyltransferase [Fischerella thermalis WC119]
MLSTTLGISPSVGNLIVTVLTFIYVFGLVALMNFCVTRFGLPQDISRKITHIGAGSIIIFLPLYSDLHWSKYLNILIMFVWLILLVQKGFFAEPNDEAVKTMTRTGDRGELLKGPLYFVVVAIICGTLFYKTFPGIVAMACLGWGDGFAPIIGSRYGRWKYEIFSNKTVEGSLAMFIFAFAASIFFVWLIIPSNFNISRIFIVALVAVLVEGCSPKEIDNLLIPATVIATTSLV